VAGGAATKIIQTGNCGGSAGIVMTLWAVGRWLRYPPCEHLL